MILRNAAARHGRRALASPISRSALRQVSTDSNAETSVQGGQPWAAPEPAPAPPKIVSSTKKKVKAVRDNVFTLGTDSANEHHGAAWTEPHSEGAAAGQLTPARQYAEFRAIQAHTKNLGSRARKSYVPTELIHHPPRPEDITLELLMASQTHMGHKASRWNPANSRYIYGVRQDIHIISLETTAAHLRRAARVVEEVAFNGGLTLFVGTRKGQMEIVTKAAELAGACHLFTKWTPGAITNRDVILQGHETRVVDHMDRKLEGFDTYTGGARPLVPDLVVCLNPAENYTVLYECGLQNIPTIGIIDTDADPSWVTYTIPANDDSFRSVAVIAGVLGHAGGKGQKRRLEAAERGQVHWRNPDALQRHMRKEIADAAQKRKEVMGRIQGNLKDFSEGEQKLLRKRTRGDNTVEVSDEEMMSMLGAAGVAEAEQPDTRFAESADAVAAPLKALEDIEAHLHAVGETTAEIEAEMTGSGASSSA